MGQELLSIAIIFILAGFVKGMLGLGMPTVAIALLALRMPPAQAIAIVVVPAIVTNIWQAFAGRYLVPLLIRLWPLLLCTAIGVLAGGKLITTAVTHYAPILLGLLLAIYAAISLAQVHFTVAPVHEKWVGAGAGLISGIVAAATGVQVIPSMPFLAAIKLRRDELVQALGLFFLITGLALIYNIWKAGLMTASLAAPSLTALACAFAGMFIGQALRQRMHPETFRRWFLIALLVFGIYLAANAFMAAHV